ncbi:MAG: FMN-binding protein, partial [Paraprevotella sp.]|nr:FMN-binding protein [Paraprevotella sp.]
MKYAKLKQVLSLLTCLLMLLAVAIQQNRKVFGHDFKGGHDEKGRVQPVEQKDDGTFVVHTGMLAKDIIGYGGNTPVDISVKEGRIVRVTPLPNAESSEFFGRLKEEGLFSRWIGMTPEEAVKADVDAVSGATFSSTAVIATVRRGMQYVVDTGVKPEVSASRRVWTSPEFLCVALVILAGSVLPSFGRSPRYRVVQLVLNVVVLGFWSGSFISYSLMVNYLSNGLHGWTSVIPVLLLIVAFVFPLFWKKNHYCAWICPWGSMQE